MPNFTDRLHKHWANLHPLAKFVSISLLILTVGVAVWKPGKVIHRNWKVKNDLKSAETALAAGNYPSAREFSYQVLRRDPNVGEVLPTLLRSQVAMADPQGVRTALGFLAKKDGTTDDRLFAWEVICRSCPTWLAAASLKVLDAGEVTDPRFAEPWAERLVSESLNDIAKDFLATQPQPLTVRLERQGLELLGKKGGGAAYEELQERLIRRLEVFPGDGAALLGVIDRIPDAFVSARLSPVLEQWKETPGQPLSGLDALRVTRVRMLANPGKTEEIFADAIVRFGKSAPLDAAEWCGWLGKTEYAEGLLTEPAANGDGRAYRMLSEIHFGKGERRKWEELLSRPIRDVPVAFLECDRSYLASKRGDIREAAAAGDRSVEAALQDKESDDALIRAAEHAGTRGMEDLARRLWVEAVKRQSGPLPLSGTLGKIFKELADRRDEDSLFVMLTIYRFLEPGNRGLTAKQLYLACLKGQATPETLVSELSESEAIPLGKAPEIVCVLAFGYLLGGDFQRAVELTNDEGFNWFGVGLSQRAIRGIALGKAGQTELAAVYLENFPWEELLPSEKRVLEQLAKFKGKEK